MNININTNIQEISGKQIKYQEGNKIFKRKDLLEQGSIKDVYNTNNKHYVWCQIRLIGTNYDTIMKEIKFMKELNHPQIINYFCWWKEDENIIMIVPKMKCTLQDIIDSWYDKDNEIYQPNYLSIWSYIQQLITILIYLKSKLIVHCDIKPSNVFLDFKSKIVLGDLGCAMYSCDENVRGTPWFIAPETWNGKGTCKSDIWSLGMLIINLATGKYPYSESNPLQIYNKHKKGILPVEFREINYINPQLYLFLKTILKTDESKRPEITKLSKILITQKNIIVFEMKNCEKTDTIVQELLEEKLINFQEINWAKNIINSQRNIPIEESNYDSGIGFD